MARIRLDDGTLHVQLTTGEKIAGLHGDVRVPLAAIREVTLEQDALAAVRGLRAPGLAIPGWTKIGTWRGRRRRSFVVARRDVPAVRISLTGGGLNELIVSTPDAPALAAELAGTTAQA